MAVSLCLLAPNSTVPNLFCCVFLISVFVFFFLVICKFLLRTCHPRRVLLFLGFMVGCYDFLLWCFFFSLFYLGNMQILHEHVTRTKVRFYVEEADTLPIGGSTAVVVVVLLLCLPLPKCLPTKCQSSEQWVTRTNQSFSIQIVWLLGHFFIADFHIS